MKPLIFKELPFELIIFIIVIVLILKFIKAIIPLIHSIDEFRDNIATMNSTMSDLSHKLDDTISLFYQEKLERKTNFENHEVRLTATEKSIIELRAILNNHIGGNR